MTFVLSPMPLSQLHCLQEDVDLLWTQEQFPTGILDRVSTCSRGTNLFTQKPIGIKLVAIQELICL
jgi:hypothetical protein